MQIKTIQASITVTRSRAENNLRDQVLRWKERYENAYKELEQAEIILEEERKKVTQNDEATAEMEKDLQKIKILLGLTEVKGRGVTVTVDDNKTIPIQQALDPNVLIVHDGDLIEIVNILKNAGAEAISINGQRIVNNTAITCDGSVVRVNGVKIGAPFVVEAIGSPEGLKGSLENSNYISQMTEDGVSVNIEKRSNITIPKYDGVINTKYMKDR